MAKQYSHIFDEENISSDDDCLDAYSTSAGDSYEKPSLVVWPTGTGQVAKFLRETNQARKQVVIRGRGTSTANGCVGKDAIILSSERMNKILIFNPKNKTIDIEVGVTLSKLNSFLDETEFTLPFSYLNSSASVGGVLAIDAYAKESEFFGKFSNLVEFVEFVDGTGKLYSPGKKEVVAGAEGISGFITRVRLKLVEKQVFSLDVLCFPDIPSLLKKIGLLKHNKEIVFFEYFDNELAKKITHPGEKYTLLVGYSTLNGALSNYSEVKALIKKIDDASKTTLGAGFHSIVDLKVSFEKIYDLISYCEDQKIPLHGHAGIGVFYAYFRKDEAPKRDAFKKFIHGLGARIGVVFGVGSKNAAYINNAERKELMRLKDEYDYNNTLNPGKLFLYR